MLIYLGYIYIFMVVGLIIKKILWYHRQLEKSSRTVDTFHWRVPSDDVYIGLFNQMRRSVIDLLILLNILHNSNKINISVKHLDLKLSEN